MAFNPASLLSDISSPIAVGTRAVAALRKAAADAPNPTAAAALNAVADTLEVALKSSDVVNLVEIIMRETQASILSGKSIIVHHPTDTV